MPPMDTLLWLPTGAAGLAAMLAALQSARRSIRLEVYIFRDDPTGNRWLAALIAAARRGVQVRVQIDAVGSLELSDAFWEELRSASGEVRWFHRFGSGRYLARDHRKLCVVDEEMAFVFGFNIGDHYDGDGFTSGWLDVGVTVRGTAVPALVSVFDEIYGRTDRRPAVVARFQRRREPKFVVGIDAVQILPVSPGRRESCLLQSLYCDLPRAKRIWLISPYFLPPPKLRRVLRRAAQHGADVRLVLPARSDVTLSQYAARRLYAGLFRAKISVYEYEPQMVHAKIFLIDEIVYVGSSNLDPRSLFLNYELMVRTTVAGVRTGVESTFAEIFSRSHRIEASGWFKARSWTSKLWERWAYLLLYRIDPWVSRHWGS